MRTNILAAVALLALAVSPQVLAQQTQGQDDQSGQTRQTTSATWSNSGSTPEQAGDLYQAKTRNDSSFGGGSTPDAKGATLPGALNPGAESLGSTRQPEAKE